MMSLNISVSGCIFATFLLCVFVSGSFIKVENGVYKRITVKVNDDVSSCHCDQVIENIQVRFRYFAFILVHFITLLIAKFDEEKINKSLDIENESSTVWLFIEF